MENKYLAYYFIDNINSGTKLLIKKFKKISLIYLNSETNNKIENLYSIKEFCRKNKIDLYVCDDFKLAIKIKLLLKSNKKILKGSVTPGSPYRRVPSLKKNFMFIKYKNKCCR